MLTNHRLFSRFLGAALAGVLLFTGFSESRIHAQLTGLFDPALEPFYHGVASGDPLPDGVILWTRVTTPQPTADVDYFVATDTSFTNIVANGTVTTDQSRDYTVKIDLRGLQPATTYYYLFRHNNRNSLTGRTRTAPIAGDGTDHLRFALASCSNHDAGYFNAYDRIANRADLDAVFHVGDYIYEYAEGVYGDPSLPDRQTYPDAEIITLDEYRGRYSLYRLQRPLIRAHQQHPWIVTWDDHEIANDAWEFGAENHQPATEGPYAQRKAEATRAYFEWLPLRDPAPGQDSTVFRAFAYGDLADLSVLDSRHEGRDLQLSDIRDPALLTDRTALGQQQRDWLIDRLRNSPAQWKIVPQQVFFSPFNVGFAAPGGSLTNIDSVASVENIFLDIWDGYPFERRLLLDTIAGVDDVVILSGDIHSSFAADVVADPVLYPLEQAGYLPLPSPTYDPATGAGSRAVEFVSPSITSANFDENIGAAGAAQFEVVLNNPIPVSPDLSVNYNPHIKFTDLDRHGYVTVDVRPDGVQGDYWYVDAINTRNDEEDWGAGLRTATGANHLEMQNAPAQGKTQQPTLAGEQPSNFAPSGNATAEVQLIHNARQQTVRVEINGEVAVPLLAYHTATPFLEVPANTALRISLIPIGGPLPAADSVSLSISFDANKRYVAVANGDFNFDRPIDFDLRTFVGAPASVADQEIGLLFFHGAQDAPAVDVLVDGTPTFTDVDYGEFSGYIQPSALPFYELAVTPAGTPNQVVARYRTTWEWWKGRTAVVFASGNLAEGTFQPWVALDNGGTYPLFPVSPRAAAESTTTTMGGQGTTSGTQSSASTLVLGVFPNPASDEQSIRFALEADSEVLIDLVDVNGRRVRQVFAGQLTAGMYTQPVDVSGLAAGSYFYVVRNGEAGAVTSMRVLIR